MHDLASSIRRAEQRLGIAALPRRKSRSDRGQFRFDARTQEALIKLLQGQDKPIMRELEKALASDCRRHRVTPPSRAVVYQFAARCVVHRYNIASLPEPARRALYNLGNTKEVPGHQLAFYCFNYGELAAASFAATLPWIDLYQAERMRGHRPTSRGLLQAVLKVRRI